ncbi:hypothetical protein BSKO_00736 [Bryopsis sp. KO-2023]|nr:hypothetical protein BSKO_00736 [Bryopsis sp. KO-2023]
MLWGVSSRPGATGLCLASRGRAPRSGPSRVGLCSLSCRGRALPPLSRTVCKKRFVCSKSTNGTDGESVGENVTESTPHVDKPGGVEATLVVEDDSKISAPTPESKAKDELDPLKEALGRAKKMAGKASFRRQALEAEAQGVAEISVEAAEAFERAKHERKEVVESLKSKMIQREKLLETLDRISGEKESLKATIMELRAGEVQDREQAAVTLEKQIEREPLSEAGLDEELETAKDLKEQQAQLDSLNVVANAAGVELSALSEEILRLENKISVLEARVGFADDDAKDAEARAETVMTAAEGAVVAELEAQAVLKETELALEKATSEIEAIEAKDEQPPVAEEPPVVITAVDAAEPAVAMKSVADVEVPQVPAETPEKPNAMQEVTNFMKKHGVTIAGAALSVALGILFIRSDTGQTLIANVVGYAKGLWAQVAQLIGQVTPDAHGAEKGLLETIWLLAASVVVVPLVVNGLPGGTPVLGFLAAGALIGPHALGIVKDIEGVRHLAEMGVVFLLFNIGLELSLERLRSMAKLVFGLGNAQVLVTTAAVGLVAAVLLKISGPAAIILGSSLALSSTAVALQVLSDRGESGSRHGRATFSILLLQDLAVVVVLMLIPLLAPKPGADAGGMGPIFKALGVAAVKAAVCMTGIIAGGRVLLRPLYRFFAGFDNQEIFAALTLLVVLGTSELTQSAGLSLALGAFLAGLLVAETEFALQVESDIAPYKGLLMGLFFMTVGMEISVGLLLAKWKTIFIGMSALLVGKVAVLAAVGPMFGLSQITSIRAGMLLAAGGEFAFVAFGEAVSQGVLPAALVNEMYLMVALSMALIPYMAIVGAKLGKVFEKSDMKALQPGGKETGDLQDHVIIAGFGRVGQLIAQLLSKRMIPFVALDVRVDKVQAGKAQDLPVYFGDAGSHAVMHSVGANKAVCVVVALDSPGANYRCVWGVKHHFSHLKTYVRAYDLDHARNLEKAGATVVIPETLEPSLQLAANILLQVKTPSDEIAGIIEDFREDHVAELQILSEQSGFSLGYGYQRADSIDEVEGEKEETIMVQGVAVPEGA